MNYNQTYHGLILTIQDAFLILEGIRQNILPQVKRRLNDAERKQITAGSIFAWNETELGMKRWTDGKTWLASKVKGPFLIYREHDSERNVKSDGLVKQSFSFTTKQNEKLHLIAYYDLQDRIAGICTGKIPLQDPVLAKLSLDPAVYLNELRGTNPHPMPVYQPFKVPPGQSQGRMEEHGFPGHLASNYARHGSHGAVMGYNPVVYHPHLYTHLPPQASSMCQPPVPYYDRFSHPSQPPQPYPLPHPHMQSIPPIHSLQPSPSFPGMHALPTPPHTQGLHPGDANVSYDLPPANRHSILHPQMLPSADKILTSLNSLPQTKPRSVPTKMADCSSLSSSAPGSLNLTQPCSSYEKSIDQNGQPGAAKKQPSSPLSFPSPTMAKPTLPLIPDTMLRIRPILSSKLPDFKFSPSHNTVACLRHPVENITKLKEYHKAFSV